MSQETKGAIITFLAVAIPIALIIVVVVVARRHYKRNNL